MATDKLTDLMIQKAINAVKRADKPRKLGDGGGMFLRITPKCSKPNEPINVSCYWQLKYRFAGTEKLLQLGVYPDVTLKEARAKREEARKLIYDKGNRTDPVAKRRADRRAEKVAAANSFEAVAREYFAKQKKRFDPEYDALVIKRFEDDIFPDIGGMPVAQVEPPILLDAIRKVEARGATDLAPRLLQKCSRVFAYAIATSRCVRNPATDLNGALEPHIGKHMPAIQPNELPTLLAAVDAYESKARLAMQMMALTFLRTSEFRHAEWAEIDFESAMWTVPKHRMKQKKTKPLTNDHKVPLCRQALAVLQKLRAINGESRYVFASENLAKPMHENTILNALYVMGYKGRMTGHGFRAVARTILRVETNFRLEAMERQMAHKEKNEIHEAYDRGDYMEERTIMMQWWGDRLDKARGMNIVPFAPMSRMA